MWSNVGEDQGTKIILLTALTKSNSNYEVSYWKKHKSYSKIKKKKDRQTEKVCKIEVALANWPRKRFENYYQKNL